MKGIVYVKFPKTGLGNLLLIWARAKVFAHINELPMVTSSWWGFRAGAWLRREKKKRLYWGYFKEDSLIKRIQATFYSIKIPTVHEPEIEILSAAQKQTPAFFLFDTVTVNEDLFAPVRSYRNYIRDEINKILSPALQRQLTKYKEPVIAVHIRRGDFKLGNPVTPLSFFIDGINAVRKSVNDNWQVTIFTDAEKNEIAEILLLPNIKLAETKPDILDILLMSKSRVLILSQSSSFSYWGAFLSDAVILKPSGDWQGELRPAEINKQTPEIKWREADKEVALTLSNYFKRINYPDEN